MTVRPPLADRLRPRDLNEMVGHARWLSPDAPLRRIIDGGMLRSLILWGPPGCGKTSLARAIAANATRPFVSLSAVLDGVKELRSVLDRAETEQRMYGHGLLLFVDEIHRWNKAQQDALLTHLESGVVVLIGATTENPSFELNAALRSRAQVIAFDPLVEADVTDLLKRALSDPRGLGDRNLRVSDETLSRIARSAAGDARQALDDLERCADLFDGEGEITLELAQQAMQRPDIHHDRSGDAHYEVLSALIKSLRGSDPDAAIYWLARLIIGGEDPMTIARRLIIFAAEDVGNADPRSLQIAVTAQQALAVTGMPEGRIILAQAVSWLACSPKSNAAYLAIGKAMADVRQYGALPVPPNLRNAGNSSYLNPHDFPHRIVAQQHLPQPIGEQRYYRPSGHGEEKIIAERLEWWLRKVRRD